VSLSGAGADALAFFLYVRIVTIYYIQIHDTILFRPLSYFGYMNNEILSQDEIDELIGRAQKIDTTIPFRLPNMLEPEITSSVKAMLKRYYYALTHCSYEEQHIAKYNLRQAAFRVWLNRYGFLDRSEFIGFINNEVKKRGLNWKLCIR